MLNDLRIAARLLRRSPGFTLLAVATLALGIAAHAAIFSVVRGVLLRPLPYPDPDRLVAIWTATADEPRSAHSAAEFLELRRESRVFDALTGFRRDLFAVGVDGGPTRQLEGVHATSDFFDVFGVAALDGRTFSRLDAAAGERVVVLGAAAAQSLTGTTRAAGMRLRLNGASFVVLGVMPDAFAWPQGAQIWLSTPREVPPAPMDFPETERDVRYFDVVGRLRPGVSPAQADADLARMSAVVATRRGASSEPRTLQQTALRDFLVGDVRAVILLLQAGVAIVLLIGAANVSGLLLARTAARRRELAVRTALGAPASRLVRALLAESLLLGLAGGAIGLAIGRWAVVGLRRIVPDGVPRTDAIALDGGVAAATMAVALALAILFGLLPAWQGARAKAAHVLRDASRGSSAHRARSRAVLVIGQVALTLVLVVSAALLATSLRRLEAVDSGYRAGGVTVGSLSIPQTRYPTAEAQVSFYNRLLDALAQRPEFTASAVGFPAPLRGQNANGTFTVDVPRATGDPAPFAYIASVSGGYFDALGIAVRGRTFTAGDRAESTAVAVVSGELARRHYPGADPVGRRLRFGDDGTAPWITIVGVAEDVRHIGLAEAPPPVLYIPHTQFTLPFTTVFVRSERDGAAVTAAVRDTVRRVDPDLALDDPAPLAGVLDDSMVEARFRTFILTALAAVAFALAIVGLYGVISHGVAQRQRELGIRIALGAAQSRLLGAIVRHAVILAGTGVAIGMVVTLVSSPLLSGFLYGVGATDTRVYAGTAALIVIVAAAASYLPARRALRVNPVVALRGE